MMRQIQPLFAVLALLLTAGSQAFAASGAVIKQLQINKGRVVVESSGELPVGTELLASFKDGSQCPLKVTASQGHIANADVSQCSAAGSLIVGQKLERSLLVDEDGVSKSTEGTHHSGNPPIKAAPIKSEWVPRPPPARKITDLQYQPNLGQSALVAGYLYDEVKTSISISPNNDGIYDLDDVTHKLAVGYQYGVTQNFAVSAVVGYLVGETAQYTWGPGSTNNGQKDKDKSDGLLDPSLGMTYRVFEQDRAPVILDVRGSYSPNAGKHKSATNNHSGTGHRGGDLLTMGAEVGGKGQTYAISASLDFNFYGSSNAVDADTGVGVRTSAINTYTIKIAGQTEVADQWLLRGSLARVSVGEYSSNDFQGTEKRIDSIDQHVITVGVVNQVLPESLIVTAEIVKNISADISGNQGSRSLNGSTDALGAHVGVLMQF